MASLLECSGLLKLLLWSWQRSSNRQCLELVGSSRERWPDHKLHLLVCDCPILKWNSSSNLIDSRRTDSQDVVLDTKWVRLTWLYRQCFLVQPVHTRMEHDLGLSQTLSCWCERGYTTRSARRERNLSQLNPHVPNWLPVHRRSIWNLQRHKVSCRIHIWLVWRRYSTRQLGYMQVKEEMQWHYKRRTAVQPHHRNHWRLRIHHPIKELADRPRVRWWDGSLPAVSRTHTECWLRNRARRHILHGVRRHLWRRKW